MSVELAVAPLSEGEDQTTPRFKPHPTLRFVPGGLGFGEPTPPLGVLSVVSKPVGHGSTEVSAATFINTDSIPELSAERRKAASKATRILGQNRHIVHNGDAESVPTPIDALGTARQAAIIKRRYGEHSPQYREVFSGLVLDTERLLAEAYSKNTAEYFAKVTQHRERTTGQYFSHGLSIANMVENGLSPLAEPEEQDRRVNDYVEERGVYEPLGRMIGRIGLQGVMDRVLVPALAPEAQITAQNREQPPSVSVMTISECTDFAIRDYQADSKGSHSGYAPAVKKFMIRGAHFFDDSADRQEEQVAVPGLYVTHELIQEYLVEKGVMSPEQEPTKTEVHATQFISVDGTGVMDVVRELDQKASKLYGKNIFMGEEVPEDHAKDYGDFVEEAEIRRAKLAPKPTELAEYLITLEESGANPHVAEALVDKFLKETLLEVAKNHPELAEAMFDKETAEGFIEVARLKAIGRHNEAWRLQVAVKANAPEVSYCGAGGCGLETVDATSAAGQRAIQLGLKRGRMFRNKESACKNCSANELHHDLEGNTVCIACNATKLKGQEVKTTRRVVSLDEKRNSTKKRSVPQGEKNTPGKILQFRTSSSKPKSAV